MEQILILSAGLFDSQLRFPQSTVTQPRKVETYELEYFFEDGGTSILNGRYIPIRRGSCLLAKPGDVRRSQLPFTCKFLHFAINDPVLTAALDAVEAVSQPGDPTALEAAFSEVIGLHFSANPFDNRCAPAKLLCLLHQLCTASGEHQTAVAKAQQYIARNYSGNLTAATIAAACDISVSYLYRLFQTALDCTPGEYLLSCRISAARELLVNTGLSLNEIAFRCGFNSQSYFSDCFKRRVGISPSAYRSGAVYMP